MSSPLPPALHANSFAIGTAVIINNKKVTAFLWVVLGEEAVKLFGVKVPALQLSKSSRP